MGRERDIRDDVSIKRYRVGSDKFNFHVKSQVGFKRTSSKRRIEDKRKCQSDYDELFFCWSL